VAAAYESLAQELLAKDDLFVKAVLENA